MNPENDEARSLTSRIYRTLRADILCCRIAPCEKLRISELQKRFDSGLSAVREALARLSTEGLVVAIDQRGFRVSPVSLDDLEDLIRTRRQIEGIALRQAMELGDALWLAEVTRSYSELVVQDQRAVANYAREEAWVAAHEQFHRSLLVGCRSPWLQRLCDRLAEQTQRYRYLSTSLAPHRDGAQEHRLIMRAVLAGDVEMATNVLDAHFAETARILLEANSDLERRSVA